MLSKIWDASWWLCGLSDNICCSWSHTKQIIWNQIKSLRMQREWVTGSLSKGKGCHSDPQLLSSATLLIQRIPDHSRRYGRHSKVPLCQKRFGVAMWRSRRMEAIIRNTCPLIMINFMRCLLLIINIYTLFNTFNSDVSGNIKVGHW